MEVEDLDRRVELRALTMDDFDELVALQKACFPTMQPWHRHEVESQLSEWPESQLGLFIDGKLAASAAHLIVDSDEYSTWSDWVTLAGNGLIRNHDPEGDTLYGIEIQVHPDYRGMRLSRRLYNARKKICRDRNLAFMRIGGRIPGYSAHADQMTAQEYVQAVVDKQIFDPVLTAHLANGFQFKEIVPDYYPSDEDSSGYATYLEWPNDDYVPASSSRQKMRATQRLRVGLVQYQMRRVESFDEFARQVEFFVDTAGDYRADFLLFPELFTLQLLSLVDSGRPGTAARALAEFTPQYLELMGRLAVKYNVNLIGGSQFTLRDDGLYNVAYVFHRDGRVDSQDKLHVTPSEGRWWGVRGGKTLQAIDTDRARIGLLICYDVQFPECARKLANDGADLLFVPYNTNDIYGHNRVRFCAAARCIENHFFAVTAGCVGNLPFVENADTHYARSAVLTPSDMAFARGGIAAEADPNIETVLCHDLDLQDLRRHRLRGTVKNWRDRRTDLYQVSWNGEPI